MASSILPGVSIEICPYIPGRALAVVKMGPGAAGPATPGAAAGASGGEPPAWCIERPAGGAAAGARCAYSREYACECYEGLCPSVGSWKAAAGKGIAVPPPGVSASPAFLHIGDNQPPGRADQINASIAIADRRWQAHKGLVYRPASQSSNRACVVDNIIYILYFNNILIIIPTI